MTDTRELERKTPISDLFHLQPGTFIDHEDYKALLSSHIGLERSLAAQREQIERLTKDRCAHGWRGTPLSLQIKTPCPACGSTSLFIAEGGHLTCARVPSDHSNGCESPSVEDTVNALRERAESAERKLAECEGMVPVPKGVFEQMRDELYAAGYTKLAHKVRDMLLAAGRKPSPHGAPPPRT